MIWYAGVPYVGGAFSVYRIAFVIAGKLVRGAGFVSAGVGTFP